MSSSSSPVRVLVPFQCEWQDGVLEQLQRDGDIVLHRVGFDPRAFPDCLRLAWFDSRRFVDRLVRRYRGCVDAVWSADEQFGCLIAAVVADRLGLPGPDPAAVVRAQHKLLLRQRLAEAMPEASVVAAAVPYRLGDPRIRDCDAIAAVAAEHGLRWPLFAKPVKATFSVLARQVDSPAVLAAHLGLPRFDRYVMRRLTEPFESLAREHVELPCPADAVLLEEPLRGHQVNVDGYVIDGRFHVFGVVDEWMYEGEVAGARHFAGFTYPSRLGEGQYDAVVDAARAAVRCVGLDHGLFNVELFVCDDGAIRVIEINPRAAGQFATFYRDVEGIQLELMGIWLAAGRDPGEVKRTRPSASVAGSIVWRRFDGGCGKVPSVDARSWLSRTYPQARLWLQPTGRRDVAREYRWVGSHRYAVLNCAAGDYRELQRVGDECGRRLFGASSPPIYDASSTVRKPAKTSVR